MSKIKKILAVVLAMAMVLMMSMSVFAEGITPTPVPSDPVVTDSAAVTINGLDSSTTKVKLYQVAYATRNATTGAVTYKMNDWATAAGATLAGLGVTDGQSGLVTTTPPASASAAALVAAPNKGTAAAELTPVSGTVTATLPVGIYVVVTEGGAVVYNPMLVSVNFTSDKLTGKLTTPTGSTITAKSVAGPTFTKTAAQTRASVAVGSDVDYTITTTIPTYDGSYTNPVFTVTDTLTALTLKAETITVTVGGATVAESTENSKTFTKEINAANDGFKVTFDPAFIKANGGATVVITYKATVNNSAVGYNPHHNEAKLTYSNSPNTTTDTNAETKHYTFDIDGILKKTGADGNALPGAEFTIYTDSACTQAYTNGLITGPAASDANGNIAFKGLAEGTYYVKETKAPTGYSLNEKVYTVVISATLNVEELTAYTIAVDGETVYPGSVNNDGSITVTPVEIPNTRLASLPSTGGIGTTIFTVVGCVLMIAAAAMFFVSRRKAED